MIFPEEQENEQESAFKGLRGLTEQATSIFHATAGPAIKASGGSQSGSNTREDEGAAGISQISSVTQPMKSGPENSKEFVELNFQVKFTDDEDKPVSAQVDIPNSQSNTGGSTTSSQAGKATESSADLSSSSSKDAVSIYDEENVIYIGPMFIIHRGI